MQFSSKKSFFSYFDFSSFYLYEMMHDIIKLTVSYTPGQSAHFT